MSANAREAVTLETFVGQRATVEDLNAKIAGCRKRGVLLPHLLFCGPSGMGKRTLARALAASMGVRAVTDLLATTRGEAQGGTFETTCEDIKHRGTVGTLLTTQVMLGDVVILGEIDSLRASLARPLVQAMTEHLFDIEVGEGALASRVQIPLVSFTAVGTTSRPSRLDRLLKPWFVRYDFRPYSEDEIATILARATPEISASVVEAIASHSEGSPGEARVLLHRVREWLGDGAQLTPEAVGESLAALGVGSGHGEAGAVAHLESMAGDEFEAFVADLYRKLGYSVEETGRSGDHGVDLIMVKNGRRVIVQCKRWDGSVGEPVLRDLFGAMTDMGADEAVLVTTGLFTTRAFAFAENKRIRLVDLDGLAELVARAKAASGDTE